MDIVFHYPPELLALLVDTLPRLCRSKRDLLLFFKGAGVSGDLLSPYEILLQTNRDVFKKHVVAREILTKLNEHGERSLRERRELLKRITEFDDFSVCWNSDQAPARGLVAQVRELVSVKDSFTRMRLEKDAERGKRIAEQEARVATLRARRAELAAVKAQLFALFGEADVRKRGRSLERVLNALFALFGMLVREAFTVKGRCGEGVIEQIDGLVELDGQLYLVELKWWSTPLGTAEVSPHVVRVVTRGGQARGLLISYSDYADSAVSTCHEARAAGAIVVLSKLQEIIALLEREGDLKNWLRAKATAAIADKNPLYLPPI